MLCLGLNGAQTVQRIDTVLEARELEGVVHGLAGDLTVVTHLVNPVK